MKYKHFFFDMDGTVCESRQTITSEMKEALERLGDIHIISGAKREQMEKQLDGLKCNIMAQSGNDTDLWYKKLTKEEIKEIDFHISSFMNNCSDYIYKMMEYGYRIIENRDCQVSFSFVGHDAPIEQKIVFDPEKSYRMKFLAMNPFNSKNLEVRIAGTTCLDYTRKDGKKGNNIKEYIKKKKFNIDECIYIGDALFKGGNDESVIEIIPEMKVVKVDGIKDTLRFAKEI